MGKWFAKTRAFIAETMDEMGKCTWPEKGQLLESTILVIVALAVTSIFVAGVDQILFHIIKGIIKS
ncbi:MAG: preprotein translocase subunit SecE [Lentisphaerae bacterium]|nr:preprotein translocase subunit SecE [Lentisphaerota bacterium]